MYAISRILLPEALQKAVECKCMFRSTGMASELENLEVAGGWSLAFEGGPKKEPSCTVEA